MDFEIDWPFGTALSASEAPASPIHDNVRDPSGRLVDSDLPNLEGQCDGEKLEPGEAAILPFLLLDTNFAVQIQPTNCRCNLCGFIGRDIERVQGTNDD